MTENVFLFYAVLFAVVALSWLVVQTLVRSGQLIVSIVTIVAFYCGRIFSLLKVGNLLGGLAWLNEPDREVLMNFAGTKLYVCNWWEVWVSSETCVDRCYGSPSAGDVVLDIGCAHGDFSIMAAQRGASVVAVDKRYDLVERLENNATINGVDIATRVAMVSPSYFRFLVERNHPTVLKMDVEGDEGDLIPASDLAGVKRVWLEWHSRSARYEVMDHLVKLGFKVRVEPCPAHRNLGLLFAERE